MTEYKIIYSDRKTLAVEVNRNAEVIVRSPKRMPMYRIKAYVASISDWIESHVEKARKNMEKNENTEKLDDRQIKDLYKKTKELVKTRIDFFAASAGVKYAGITVRCQKTRWGSCSAKNSLNFNCLLALMPEEIVDYVIVHELCHIKEHNHSASFWNEVEKILPDYRERRRWLKTHGSEYMRLVY